MRCSRCQNVLREGALFCHRCGQTVSASGKEVAPSEPTTNSDSLIGQVLDSKYTLLERLGAGGMGTVYRARRHLGDEVAIKVLHSQYLTDQTAVKRFRREAMATAGLHHPNIVSIHDFADSPNHLTPSYIVMELIEGESLSKLLQREGRLKLSRAMRLMKEICAGVAAAHRRNVLHRDLKSDNILVLSPNEDRVRETVKIVDFGLVKLRDETATGGLTRTGAMLGTPHYMSPEQCLGESLDARSDAYSLGAIFYEMLTGTTPFIAETLPELISKQLYQEPPAFPVSLNISPVIEKIVLRALAKDPNLRQKDACMLAQELQSAENYLMEEARKRISMRHDEKQTKQ